jgi:hypothetical protein
MLRSFPAIVNPANATVLPTRWAITKDFPCLDYYLGIEAAGSASSAGVLPSAHRLLLESISAGDGY